MITSCAGTSITISRRLIRTIRSTPGMIHLRPAAFTSRKRPSRNITPRSYSWSTRTPRKNSTARIASAPSRPVDMTPPARRAPALAACPARAARAAAAPRPRSPRRACPRGTRLDRSRAPVLAADEHLARRIEVATPPCPPSRSARRRRRSGAAAACARPRTPRARRTRRTRATTGTSTDQNETVRSLTSGRSKTIVPPSSMHSEARGEEQAVRRHEHLGDDEPEPEQQHQAGPPTRTAGSGTRSRPARGSASPATPGTIMPGCLSSM